MAQMKKRIFWMYKHPGKLIISNEKFADTKESDYGSFPYDIEFDQNSVPWKDYRTEISSVEIVGKVAPLSTANWFKNCLRLRTVDVTCLDTSNVISMACMFQNACRDCRNFSIVGMDNWNVSKVADMSYMFQNCGRDAKRWDSGSLGHWNTSHVQNMEGMFEGAGSSTERWFVGDISKWNTSHVMNMRNMFQNAGKWSEDAYIGFEGWNTSKVMNMDNMFKNAWAAICYDTLLDLSSWDIKNVLSAEGMFSRVPVGTDRLRVIRPDFFDYLEDN